MQCFLPKRNGVEPIDEAPNHRHGRETARSYQKRIHTQSDELLNRLHPSVSLEDSRRWFAHQVALQKKKGCLFEDPLLPADDSSVKGIGKLTAGIEQYKWLRPHDLTDNPKFIIDGISRFDIKQGEIGDCWFLAAISSLSMHTDLQEQVVPTGQSFDIHTAKGDIDSNASFSYCGMFWFRFWRFGEWVDIVVDDRLPTRHRELAFVHSSNRDEFWSALMEKAYAKLIGSYEGMRGGNSAEAMEDFTGGLTEMIDLGTKAPPNLFQIMQRAHSRRSLMACSMDAPPEMTDTDGPFGLIYNHAYSVTDVCTVIRKGSSNQVQLVRLRNPWGNDSEWSGPWSDSSDEWKSISHSERDRIGLHIDNDGEFWMGLEDFCYHFSRLECCHLGPGSGVFGETQIPNGNHHDDKESTKRRWEMTREDGEWISHATAGGCLNFRDTFPINPQYRVRVIDPDETDDDNTGTIIIGLMQKGRRESLKEHHTIGYVIYRLPPNWSEGRLLSREFFQQHSSIARSPAFVNVREVCGRHKLAPGDYMIMPSTYSPMQEATFLLRIFSERPCKSDELDDSITLGEGVTTKVAALKLDDATTNSLRSAFDKITGSSDSINTVELMDIMNEVFQNEFPNLKFEKEIARSMVALMDTNMDGSLQFDEFEQLWIDLRLWLSVFKAFDRDQSGTLDAFELRDVMRALGIQVSNHVYNTIIRRYADLSGQINFDDYILLLVRLVTVIDIYKAQEHLKDGRATFSFEEFTRTIMYI